MVSPTLYFIRGVPGSGKSSLAKSFLDSGLVSRVLEADYWFTKSDGTYDRDVTQLPKAHRWCQSQAAQSLFMGESVAVANTSPRERDVADYKQIAESFGAKFVSIVVESRHDGKNIHGVPPEKVEQMRKQFSIKL